MLELVASTVSPDTRTSTPLGPLIQEVRLETGEEEKRKHLLTREELEALVTLSDPFMLMSALAGYEEHYNNRSALWSYSRE